MNDFKQWYECNTDNESFNLDEYDLEECEYREEDESMRLPIKEYDRLHKAYVELSKNMKGTINYEQR